LKRRQISAALVAGLAFLVTGSAATSAQNRGREGYIVTPDSLRLFYRVTGAGPDTLIAIHGGPGVDLESIAADFAPLEARHTIIFYDQRGAGRSTLPADTARLGARQQVEDLETVRRRFGIARMTLIAHSYGPLLAASYALAHPDRVRRMVFFGPVPPRRGDLFNRMGTTFNARLDSTERSRLAEAAKRLVDPRSDTAEVRRACREYWSIALRPRLADPDRSLALIKSDLCASSADGIRFGLDVTNRVVMESHGNWDLRAPLAALDVPTLIVHGEEEAIPMDLVEVWVRSMPHAQLMRVPGAAHFTYAERPEIVWPAVERFLSGNESVKH
jgi:proline iminopeptidase